LKLTIGLFFAVAGAAAGYGLAADVRHMNLKELGDYYSSQTAGTIQAHPFYLAPNFHFSFHNQEKFPYAMVSDVNYETGALKQLFTFDVEKFNVLMGEPDFLSANTKFYSRIPFYDKPQAHWRGYYYLHDWGQLFHPPVVELTLPIEKYFAALTPDFDPAQAKSVFFDPEWQKSLDAETGTELTYGNELQLLNNNEAYKAKLDLVSRAKKTMWVSVMMFICDESGSRLADALIERKKAGVDVRMIIEQFYFDLMERGCIDRLYDAGIRIARSDEALHLSTAGTVHHQKVWLRDGEEMIIGGENILDYENESDGLSGMNRDGDVRVKGPSVTDGMFGFMHEFQHYARYSGNEGTMEDSILKFQPWVRGIKRKELNLGLRGKDNYATWLGSADTRMNGVCRVAMQSFILKRQPIEPILLRHLQGSTKLVLMTTPDLKEDPKDSLKGSNNISAFMRQLEATGGGDLEPEIYLITNGRGGGAGEPSTWMRNRIHGAEKINVKFIRNFLENLEDSMGTGAAKANRDNVMALQKMNPKFHGFGYFQYMHAKHFMFDRLATFVGSWNIDVNSGDKNHEAGIICLDDGLRKSMEKRLAQDFANSLPVVSSNGK
jgi:phosphatidylserine/phosphatidylglycerophosphate/cardiolipin synthase-like enzyme